MNVDDRRARSAVLLQRAVAAVAVLLAFLAWRRTGEGPGYWLPARGLVLALACLWPAWDHLRRVRASPERAEPLPFLPIVGAIYAVYFALPVLLADRPTFMSAGPDVASLTRASDLALAGWTTLLVGYRLAGRLGRVAPAEHFRMDPARARRLAWPLVLAGLGCELLLRRDLVPAALTQPVVLLSWLHAVGVGIGFLAVLRGELVGLARAAMLGLGVPSLFLVRLGDFGIGPLVFTTFYLLLLVWAVRGAVPWRLVLPGLVAILLVKGSVADFRRVLAAVEPGSLGRVERAELLGEVLVERVDERGLLDTASHALETVRDRTAMLALFAHVIERTPHVVPHWNGQSYRHLPASVVPRVLWPDKPEKRMGQEFGHSYGLLAPWDDETVVNCPQVVELFVNFGSVGVLLGMALFGALYRLLVRWWSVPGADDGTLLVGSLLFSRLFYLESDVSFVWGMVLQAGIALFLTLRLFGARA